MPGEADLPDGFRPAAVLADIERATAELLASAAALDDDAVRAPSLLPGWTRGHVLTHVARNADGGTRLLRWARTGVEGYEYASTDARAAEIEAGAGRPAAELAADVRRSAERFAREYRLMRPRAWTRTVRWTSGQERPAARAADSRLTEVLVHHVDLDAGYTPADWPADFAGAMLARVVAAFAARDAATVPAMRLAVVDTGTAYEIGAGGRVGEAGVGADGTVGGEAGVGSGTGSGGEAGVGSGGEVGGSGAAGGAAAPVRLIRGTQRALLAWLMGRPPGRPHPTAEDGGPLPDLPFLY